MGVVFKGHFKGLKITQKSRLFGEDTITLSAKDFQLLTNRFLLMEYELFDATGKESKPIKDY